MNRPANSKKQAELKFHSERSHNPDSLDERIIALVRLMARCAAEEDYRNRSPDHHQDKGGN